MKSKKMIAAIVLFYLVFLFDLKVTISRSTTTYQLRYNGLVWVALDYYTIIKYHSSDTVMKWVAFEKTELK